MELAILTLLMKIMGDGWAIILGLLIFLGHFYFKYRSGQAAESRREVNERHHEIERMLKELEFLTKENRNLRVEIQDLRDTYALLHGRYLESLNPSRK